MCENDMVAGGHQGQPPTPYSSLSASEKNIGSTTYQWFWGISGSGVSVVLECLYGT